MPAEELMAMTSGGRRNRGGPTADENSGRSDKRGFKLTALPAEGYTGPIPEWPLSVPVKRERELWAQLWRTPQACAWSMPSESWRVRSVAMYCRLFVRCEHPEAPASIMAQLHRFADQVGLTTAGLAEMGWKVAVDEVGEKRHGSDAPVTPRRSARDRMKIAKASGD